MRYYGLREYLSSSWVGHSPRRSQGLNQEPSDYQTSLHLLCCSRPWFNSSVATPSELNFMYPLLTRYNRRLIWLEIKLLHSSLLSLREDKLNEYGCQKNTDQNNLIKHGFNSRRHVSTVEILHFNMGFAAKLGHTISISPDAMMILLFRGATPKANWNYINWPKPIHDNCFWRFCQNT